MADIKIENIKGSKNQFSVKVSDTKGDTTHQVTLSDEFYKSLDTKLSREKVIRASFKFLLERESKESILPSFKLSVIGKYFPEYKEEIKSRLK